MMARPIEPIVNGESEHQVANKHLALVEGDLHDRSQGEHATHGNETFGPIAGSSESERRKLPEAPNDGDGSKQLLDPCSAVGAKVDCDAMNTSGHEVTFDESEELESIQATAVDGDYERVVRQDEADRTHHQWVIDRCNGESKLADYHPPCRLCWVPSCVKCCPTILEQNFCCESIGRIGIGASESRNRRRRLMGIGMVTSIIGAILTMVSCFAISTTNYSFIRNTAFTAGHVNSTAISATSVTGGLLTHINVDIGLAAVAYDNPRTVGKTVVEFQQLCNLEPGVVVLPSVDRNLALVLPDQDQCFVCTNASTSLISTTITSLLTYIPSISTNILRMHENYDTNCQKSFGIIVTLLSFSMSLYTWIGYRRSCFDSLFEGVLILDRNWDPVDAGNSTAALIVDFGWGPGPGYICIIIATVLKIVDVICHLLLRTPSITRDHQEQADYEKL